MMKINKFLVRMLCGILIVPNVYADSETKYRVSIGSMAFSDFSKTSESDYVGASFSIPMSISAKNAYFKWVLSSALMSQIQDDSSIESGLGDASLSLSYTINDWLSIKGKHKFAIGNQDLGFSTGEDDNALSFDFFHIQSYNTSYFATTGYKWVGKGERIDRRDAFNASLGTSYWFSGKFTLAGSLDYNQSSYLNTQDTTAITVFGSHKLDKISNAGWFVSADDTSTYSIGTNFSYSF